VFHPAGCELCDQLLTRASCVPICGECLASYSALPQTVCEVCGSPVVAPFSLRGMNPAEKSPGDAPRGCLACQGRACAFACARSCRVRRQIDPCNDDAQVPAHGATGRQVRGATEEFGTARGSCRRRRGSGTPDRQRHRERGYNQADLIARSVAHRLNLPCRLIFTLNTECKPNKMTVLRVWTMTSEVENMATASASWINHPGTYIREEMEERGWSQRDLAFILGCSDQSDFEWEARYQPRNGESIWRSV
jgi:hypothetical protein